MRITALLLAATAIGTCPARPGKNESSQAAPNTSTLAFAAAGGNYKIYFPAAPARDGSFLLAVVDAAAPNATNGLLHYVDLGATAEPIAVGVSGRDVVVADAGTPIAYVLDAVTDRLVGTVALPPETAGGFVVSDNILDASGVAVDSQRRRAWISVSTGIVELDLDALAVTTTYAAPPSENFAYDPGARTIYAPFYLCDPDSPVGGCAPFPQPGGPAITDSLTVVNVATQKTYTAADPSATVPSAPLGFGPDGIALDTTLGVAALTEENPAALQVVEQDAIQCDDAALTCRVPLLLRMPLGEFYSAVTVDPHTHLAAIAQEGGSGIVFVDLALAKAGTLRFLDLAMPDLPDAGPWVSRYDPHGLTVGVMAGKPYVFLVHNDKTWIARVDIQRVAALQSSDLTAFADMVEYFLVPVPKGRGG